jgi:hypothetical protein
MKASRKKFLINPRAKLLSRVRIRARDPDHNQRVSTNGAIRQVLSLPYLLCQRA